MKTDRERLRRHMVSESKLMPDSEGIAYNPPPLFGETVQLKKENISETGTLSNSSSPGLSIDPYSIINKFLSDHLGALGPLLGNFFNGILDISMLGNRFIRGIIETYYLSSVFNGTIDHTFEAVIHYYFGRGTPVTIGPKTRNEMQHSTDQQYYSNRISQGLTSSPASGSYGINMEDESVRSYHMGNTPIRYSTVGNTNTCTTTFTSIGDGFWDIFWGGDKGGSGGELGGYPYAYLPFSWTETFKNPGYPIDPNGIPSQIPSRVTPGNPPNHYYDSIY